MPDFLNKRISASLYFMIILLALILVGITILWHYQGGKEISDFTEKHQGLLTVLLTISGWFSVFWLGLSQQRRQLKDNAKMKIYKELWAFRKRVDGEGTKLGVLLSRFPLPFLQMKYETSDALRHWFDYLAEISKEHYSFTSNYLKLWVHIEMWISIMPELKTAKTLLFSELEKLTKKLYDHHRYLQHLPVANYDWRTWNKEGIERKTDYLGEEFDKIVCYLDDFMVLVHNILIAPIVGYEKNPRETIDFSRIKKPIQYKILTKKGFIEASYSPIVHSSV